MVKAWFVTHKEGDYGEIVLAETRGKAILGSTEYDNDAWPNYIDYRARRVPGADNREYVRPETYLQNGFRYPCTWCERDIHPDEPYKIGSNGYDVFCEECDR